MELSWGANEIRTYNCRCYRNELLSRLLRRDERMCGDRSWSRSRKNNSFDSPEYSIPLLIHSADSPMLDKVEHMELSFFLGAKNSPPPDKFLVEGEKVMIGSVQMEIIHTPGHSPGSVSLLSDGVLFSGDTLFSGGVGRTDLPGGSWNELVCSIKEKILALPQETPVLPGHGPATTVGQEERSNPFIQ